MKLKRLYWARAVIAAVFCIAVPLLTASCSSSKIAFPIPGQRESAVKNIYIEYMNLADAYYELEKYDKAVSYYKAAMENKDIYWTAYYKLARCYVYQSKWDTAQTSYETLLKRDPKNNSLKSSLAYIYAMNGNVEKSTAMYEELIESNPDQSEYLENYICVLLGAEKKEEAEASYKDLCEKFPQSKRLEEFEKVFPKPEETKDSENNEEAQTTTDSILSQ